MADMTVAEAKEPFEMPPEALKLRRDLPREAQLGLLAIEAEFIRASRKFGSFASAHEGYAVLKEEVDELWDEVKAGGNANRLRSEAIQVGAMALRFLFDVCPMLPEVSDE